MDPQVISAIITSIVAMVIGILSAITSIIAFWLNRKDNKRFHKAVLETSEKTSYRDGITNNRMVWLRDFRQLVFRIISYEPFIEASTEKRTEIIGLIRGITVYFSPTFPFDLVIRKYCVRMHNSLINNKIEEYYIHKELFEFSVLIFIKIERSRIRDENKGVLVDNSTHLKNIKKIMSQTQCEFSSEIIKDLEECNVENEFPRFHVNQ